ncbi:hypothetical protein WEN_02565 [Mycoplasma wenyonii str. Massachusetts]|uniref:Uncharacterized protein n=1 Tax=Mycoplasma wenyonii (strain Massachusetts) TaxID=1197325 RepID=I6Z6U2_MYCWM|nr:hypothetical protein [Mycoplasma wenyonii]AFN65298.1 hypothetical protein WEN_02565 [Mycoplasma wenyonii str. Massachusetts]
MFSRLLGISPSLLKKLLIVASGGGSSVFYFGFPESQVAGTNRKIKWTLKREGKNEETDESIEKQGDKWVTEKKKWQGLDISEWNEVGDNNVKTIYKLILKKEFIKEELVKGNNSVKGVLGLFKVNLKQEDRQDKKVKLEEINEEEAKAIWLIVAKGKKSIYLIPTVRAYKENGKLGQWKRSIGNCLEGIINVWDGGVGDLKGWKDNGKLGDKEAEELEGRLRNGFIIARGGKGYGGSGGNWKGGRSSDIDSFVNGRPGRSYGKVVIYKNAGILAEKNNRKKVCEKEDTGVRYFPLDIKELGGTILKELKSRSQSSWSEIEVSEKIEDVGIFKWEKLRVSETGIGDGVGKDLIWGNDKKIVWTPELLK